jgi:hypothetical protein
MGHPRRHRVSIHAPRAGGDAGASATLRRMPSFNPRPPRGGRLRALAAFPCATRFNPRPPRGGDPVRLRRLWAPVSVSIHAPRAGGDGERSSAEGRDRFQSTPPARGATRQAGAGSVIERVVVSIHAPRAGGDSQRWSPSSMRGARPPRFSDSVFQSTPPARGATAFWDPRDGGSSGFNPRPPRGGRPGSISRRRGAQEFQSTPPARGATGPLTATVSMRGGRPYCAPPISCTCFNPRPPRGGDQGIRIQIHGRSFNPRPPRGGRRAVQRLASCRDSPFQSTPPARGATVTCSLMCQRQPSHSPRNKECFNPRPPRGGRRPAPARRSVRLSTRFNPRPPRGGRRRVVGSHQLYVRRFNPRPRAGGDSPTPRFSPRHVFQSTPPARGATTLARRGTKDRPPFAFGLHIGFNPRPPRGGRPGRFGQIRDVTCVEFQSTPPARGATARLRFNTSGPSRVSIHAPRAGGDEVRIRRPLLDLGFQSTPPARGATTHLGERIRVHARGATSAGIHAPRAGGDPTLVPAIHANVFQSTPPRGGATSCGPRDRVSIHAPRAGGDRVRGVRSSWRSDVSIHAPRAGGGRYRPPANRSTPPRGGRA